MSKESIAQMKVLYEDGSFVMEPETDVEKGLLRDISNAKRYLDGQVSICDDDSREPVVVFQLRSRILNAEANRIEKQLHIAEGVLSQNKSMLDDYDIQCDKVGVPIRR
jgi:hypothetical protein